MANVSVGFTAFNYGYVSPRVRGRADLDFYNQSLDYILNYIVTAQGEANYRYGSIFVAPTKGNKVARLVPYLFNTEQAYILEFTDQFMRVYKDHGLVTSNQLTITGVTQASTGVLSYTGTDPSNGDPYFISGIIGMHQLNQLEVMVANVDTGANTFELNDPDGNPIDTTSFSAYVSGGTAGQIVQFATPWLEADLFDFDFTQTNDTMYVAHKSYEPRKITRSSHTSWSVATYSRTADPFGAGPPLNWPSCVTLFEGRLVFAASDANPTRLWFSKAGALDNFTTGTAADDAMIFTVRSNQANRILWLEGAEDYLAIGTSGSEFRASGGGQNDAITPTNISVKPTSFNGSARIKPIRLDSYILFGQRNRKTIRSFEYNALQDGYTAPDRTLLADHIGKSKFKQFSYTAGTPNIVWGVRNDGRLTGLTFDPAQQVVAWHQHKTQGNYISVSTIPEENDDDELWQVVERTIGGVTKRYVEYVPNVPEIPVIEDYFTGRDNKTVDEKNFYTALWQTQKTILHVDSALIYDGRDLATVSLTITGNLTAGESVVVHAGGAFFEAGHVGRRIQTPEGGQIQITNFTSSTVVSGTVLYDVEASSFAINKWFWMTQQVTGASHLEGKTVSVLADGGVVEQKTVTNGVVSIDEYAGYIMIGLGYTGIGKGQNIEGGGQDGPAQTKPRNIDQMGVRLRASIGTQFGTSLYNTEEPPYRQPGGVPGRPPYLVDGAIIVKIPDNWDEEKTLFWLHETPTPSNIQYIMPHMETNDA